MGPDTRLKYIVLVLVVFQIVSCYYIGQLSYWWILPLAYCLGGVINHSLTLAIHENAHNLTFGNFFPLANRLFGMFANLPIGVPMSISFKHYHIEHHRYQGIDTIDMDIPTEWEAVFFKNTPRKILWMFLQPLFYALRPVVVRPKPPTPLEILNVVIQIAFDVFIVFFFGFKSLFYLISGTLLSMGLHPMAAHFIAEHYVFERGYETYSYYGIWNKVAFNVGYHMEHHDFPYIPGSRLPEVRRIASEFYDPLPKHHSWVKVIWDFLFDHRLGPYARVKRKYDDILGTRKDSNHTLSVDAPSTWPMKSKEEVEVLIEIQERNLFQEPLPAGGSSELKKESCHDYSAKESDPDQDDLHQKKRE